MSDTEVEEKWDFDGTPIKLRNDISANALLSTYNERLKEYPGFPASRPITILQFTDFHYFNDGSDEDKAGLDLISSMVGRIQPHLVVFTGDIIDGRYCKTFHSMKDVIQPVVQHGVPWAYVPGNHDDETEEYTRKQMTEILSYPGCISSHANTFSNKVELGPIDIYLLDSNAYIQLEPKVVYDFIHKADVEWYSKEPSNGEVGIAFYHIPIIEYKSARVLVGNNNEAPCTPIHNSKFFDAVKKKGDVHAMFVGHDHWNDYVSELDNIWLGYGRVTAFTPPSYYDDLKNQAKCPERGGRVIQYDSQSKTLSTWIETVKGKVPNSFISKIIQQKKN